MRHKCRGRIAELVPRSGALSIRKSAAVRAPKVTHVRNCTCLSQSIIISYVERRRAARLRHTCPNCQIRQGVKTTRLDFSSKPARALEDYRRNYIEQNASTFRDVPTRACSFFSPYEVTLIIVFLCATGI